MSSTVAITVRRAIPADSDMLFHWRNDPLVRAASRDQRPLVLQDHAAWFARALEDVNRLILIGVRGEEAIGMVRFDYGANVCEVSILLAKAMRGRSMGQYLLAAALDEARSFTVKLPLVAVVKCGNQSSISLFASAGFLPVSEEDGYLRMELLRY